MANVLIKYRDFDGNVTERQISDISFTGAIQIDAYCHLRQGYRSFKIDRIEEAVDIDTGEVLNPWKFIANGLAADGRETLWSLTWLSIPAIKALKFFTLTMRGFAKRERDRVVQFIQEVADVKSYSKDEIDEWVRNLWCGNVYAYRNGDVTEYTNLLRNIPSSLLKQCRDYAWFIAKGSGRKPMNPSWVERIETEFSLNPRVRKPEHQGEKEEGISIKIELED